MPLILENNPPEQLEFMRIFFVGYFCYLYLGSLGFGFYILKDGFKVFASY